MKHDQRNDRTQQQQQEQQLLIIPAGRRKTSRLFRSAAEKLNHGLPGTNSMRVQNES